MMTEKMITLNNGVEIPQLALGTWIVDDNKVAEPVKTAIRLGYRHVDTAQAYANEVGRHAIVGAGSVVTKDVPDYAVAVGNPAKVIKMLDKEKFQED